MEKGNKKEYIQILSVISSFAVVVLHVNGCFWSFSYDRYWITANIIESVMYFPVPVFFMISGATLIDYRERYSTGQYIVKRVKKTVVPYIIWTIIAILYYAIKYDIDIKSMGIADVFVGQLFAPSYISAYWFFIPLFAVYISIPFLSYINKENRKKAFVYGFVAAFISISCLPFIFNIFGWQYNQALYVPIASQYVMYVLIGYVIDNYDIPKKYRICIYVSGLVALLVHIVGTQLLSYEYGYVKQNFKGYLNVPCVVYSVSIFVAFKYLNREKVKNVLVKVTKPFASATFGIYLIHMYFIMIALEKLNIQKTSIYYRTFGAVLIFVVCAVVVKIIQKIPFIKRCIP